MKFLSNLLLGIALLSPVVSAQTFTDDFFQITNSDKRKQEFIQRMVPLVEKANEDVLAERKIVDDFFAQYKKTKTLEDIDAEQVAQIEKLAAKYHINSITNEKTFKARVAPVPLSLAITQAAIETGWGNSRFFKEAKNAFGEWTWSQENGLVPNAREKNKTHKVRVFDSVQASVNSYVLNLNRNKAYSDFRDLRVVLGSEFNGIVASSKMVNYSQKREQYVQLLRQVMISNKLLKYDYIKA